jgi:predicted alpha/beta superfamily hydrolase
VRRARHAAAFLSAMFITSPTPGAAQVVPHTQPHTLTGEFRTHAKFHSKFLTTDRDVLVYLPPGYASEGQRRYPVLYLHDGQNLFDGATSFVPGQEWRVDETAQALILARAVEPVIIVGVYNTGRERVGEYTPTRSSRSAARQTSTAACWSRS